MKHRVGDLYLVWKLFIFIWIPIKITGEKVWQSATSLEEQQKILHEKERNCNRSEQTKDGYCPTKWDGIMCWWSVPAGEMAKEPCPSYVQGFNVSGFAHKNCTFGGFWYRKEDQNITETWTNFSECFGSNSRNLDALNDMKVHVDRIKLMKTIGYSLSLQALVVAFCILLSMKKLRCTRNTLHMHLFVSFILRAAMCLIKDGVFVDSIAFSYQYDKIQEEEKRRFLMPTSNMTGNETLNEFVLCRFVTSFWHYCLMANYFWILVEGLYLHNLIFLATFAESKGKRWYFVLGWVAPVPFIVAWGLGRYKLDTEICWTKNNHIGVWWIIRCPITVSIIINFFFFINIVRVLSAKLKTSNAAQARKFRKLAKSTLVLVPLFGVHYMATIGLSIEEQNDEYLTKTAVWLYIDQFFSSFQGLCVAFLYCFLNGEVQTEIRKKWERWQLQQGNPARPRASFFTQSLSYFSKGRNSLPSIHSSSEKRDSLTNYNSRPSSPTSHVCNGKTVYDMNDKQKATSSESIPILKEQESKL